MGVFRLSVCVPLCQLESLMAHPLINVETEMRHVVRKIGGTVLEDQFEKPPLFQNADFIFDSRKVVAELKIFTEDNFRSSANDAKATNLWRRYHAKKLVSDPTPNERDWQALPRAYQNEIYKAQTRPIQKRVREAHAQVRETKARFGKSDYAGMLIVANDGITSITPTALIGAVHLWAMKPDFPEFRHFVFLTANLLSVWPQERVAQYLWVSFDLEKGPPIDDGFLDELREAWKTHHHGLTGYSG